MKQAVAGKSREYEVARRSMMQAVAGKSKEYEVVRGSMKQAEVTVEGQIEKQCKVVMAVVKIL